MHNLHACIHWSGLSSIAGAAFTSVKQCLGPITFSCIAATFCGHPFVTTRQSFTEIKLPKLEIFLLEHDLHDRKITREISLGSVLAGVILIFLIVHVGIGVVILCHLIYFMEMQLYKFHQILSAAGKVCPLQHFKLYWTLHWSVWSGTWKQLLAPAFGFCWTGLWSFTVRGEMMREFHLVLAFNYW